MEKKNYIVAIDIGSSEVVVAVATLTEEGNISIVTIVSEPTREGMTAGMVDNSQLVAEALRKARQRAEQEAAAEAARQAEIRNNNIKENSEEIYFTIGSYYIRKAESEKITRLAKWLSENPDYRVSIVGYADKETGTSAGNLRLSERRAAAVKAALLKAGIEESRIDSGFFGDKEQPYEKPSQNRVVICTLE